MATSKIKKHTNQVPDYSNGTLYNTPDSGTNQITVVAPDDGTIIINKLIAYGTGITVNGTIINYLTPTYFGTSTARLHCIFAVKKGDVIVSYVDNESGEAVPLNFCPNRRGGGKRTFAPRLALRWAA